MNSDIRDCRNENKVLKDDEKKISKILESKTVKTTKKRFNYFKEDIDNLLEPIRLFIQKFEKMLQRAANHIVYKFLPNTNNNIECYFGVALPILGKRKYRTMKGLKRRLKLSDIQ